MTTPYKPCFYGSATIGTKGQIVIPQEAREDLGLNPGDKVVVIGVRERGMVGICKLESVEQMFTQMSEHLEKLRQVIDTSKEQKKEG
ncbi:MAG TPA: AbrB/MazE/SpoVT family DNA-binding domain-containing protein [Magnetospirillaceae bacterium]|nr:AbrB/MazE/SpoVT family DNA-binding domain-containing protein [Magnetospirillaceae bacterium]